MSEKGTAAWWKAEAEGWRKENDRHRQLYINAVKERDDLSSRLSHEMAAGQSMEGQCHDLEAERDRLRAVVDGLRGYLSMEDVEYDEHEVSVIADIRAIVAGAQLDVSPDMGEADP